MKKLKKIPQDLEPRVGDDRLDPDFDRLFFHPAAHAGVGAFIKHGLVGQHPLYLVGIEVPPHRGGPALASLLILSDGRLLAATSRPWRGKKDLNELFPYDSHFCDRDELQRYSHIWYDKLGGFASIHLDVASAYDAAVASMDSAQSAHYLAEAARLDEDRSKLRLPWDAPATAVMSTAGVACTVFGFTPDLELVAALEIPDGLRRSMVLAPPPIFDRISTWRQEIEAQLDPQINDLLDESWAVGVASPRASVVLCRTAAERVIDCLGAPIKSGSSFLNRIAAVRRAWQEEPAGLNAGAKAREIAWRAGVLACLETARELGNLVHQQEPVTVSEAVASRAVMERLVESALRKGTLDSDPRATSLPRHPTFP